MIRQAISCDICGAEKKETNHWFVSYEQGGELRLSEWSSRSRSRPSLKHLCGQACLHKLVDDFMVRMVAVRAQRLTGEVAVKEPFVEAESSARLLTLPPRIPPKPVPWAEKGRLAMPANR